MNKKLLAVKSSDEPLTDIELHNLSRNETISQDEHEMTVLGRTQELNVSKWTHPLDPGTKLIYHSGTSVLYQYWVSRAH